jgi:predicted RNase H-like nuclease
MDAYIGFDSAWTDNPKAPGAICAVCFENGRPAQFHAPQLVSFAQAHTFIQAVSADDGYALLVH